eukprot:PITA_30757
MVDTRSQKNREMAANCQARANHAMKDATRDTSGEFIDKVLGRMDALESSWNQEVGSMNKEWETISKVKEEIEELRTQHDELKTQFEYTDYLCMQLEGKVKEVEELRDQGIAELVNLKASLDKANKALEGAQDEIAVLKKAVRHNPGGGVPHVKVKEPESYDGTRSAKVLGNFLWDIEQYLERLNLSKGEAQVKVAAQFLTSDAKMWWRRRADQIVSGSADDITSWDDMKKALQSHFSPQDETWEARTKIKFIKQTGSLQTYQQEYSSAVLELPDMAEKDKVFNFIIGLKPWACNEVKRQKIRTLEEAFAAVDRLVDQYDETSSEKKKFDKPKEKKKEGTPKADSAPKEKKPLACWICAGPYMARIFPSRPKIVVATQEEEEDNASVGMMQILGASATTEVTSSRNPERNKLEYVRMKIGGTEVLTMIDSGASHNFMSEDTVRRLELKFVPVEAHMKTVNSPPTAILGIAEKVDTVLGEWSGKADFTIVRIDDYEAVLGMEFMKQFKAMVVPHLRKLFIYDGREEVPIGVPTMGVLAEQELVIQSLSDSILGLTRRLELVEDDDEEGDIYVRPNVQREGREAYLRRMEVEDPDRWIELISEGEPPGSPSLRSP